MLFCTENLVLRQCLSAFQSNSNPGVLASRTHAALGRGKRQFTSPYNDLRQTSRLHSEASVIRWP